MIFFSFLSPLNGEAITIMLGIHNYYCNALHFSQTTQ